LGQAVGDRGDEQVAVGEAGGVAGEARVAGPGRLAEGGTQPAKLPVAADGEHDRAVGGGEALIGDDGRVRVSERHRDGAGTHKIHADVGEAGDLGVEQGEVDVLAEAAAVALVQGGEDGDDGVEAGAEVGDGDPDLG